MFKARRSARRAAGASPSAFAEALELLRRESFAPEGIEDRVTFSAGVAQFPEDGQDLRALYRAADEALYAAKASGRDRALAAR